ncbi:MAG: sigma-70 family RNA polymerase sigma factor [Sulfurihydrogenibium sp.]|jgi:RNA polymerase primary sigma factor|uniref:sigma-70 family RNA polymerase sigma factor n=1 Tax=Sulfurihydrogenibium sp. TaxID=2053621 RepID=UPI000CAEC0CB|nr:MAG: RNA polymerase subunit sigma [Sulfurihydrogenibium sp.]
MRKFKYEEGVEYYIKSIYKIPLLSQEEEKELLEKIKAGDKEAFKKLILSNLRFVINVAKKYAGYDVPFQDLISAGNIGLIEAAKRFDSSKGVRFISYAIWWIKQSILNTINIEGEIIKKPSKVQNISQKINNAYYYLKDSLQREPSIEEVQNFLKREGIEVEKDIVEYHIFFKQYFLSLDTPILTNDEDIVLSDTISNAGTEDLERELNQEDLLKCIDELLETLSPRERMIIIHRFGLYGEEPKTLKEVGDLVGISRERVRQIEKRLIKKLRNIAVKKNFYDLIK